MSLDEVYDKVDSVIKDFMISPTWLVFHILILIYMSYKSYSYPELNLI